MKFMLGLLWAIVLGLILHLILLEDRLERDKAASGVDQEVATPGLAPKSSPSSNTERLPAPEAAPSQPEAQSHDSAVVRISEPSADLYTSPRDLAQLDDGYAVTPEGLAAYTFELWLEHEEFLDLNVIEASALLGEHLGTYPQSLQDYLGGFPTLLDCDEALTHGDVIRHLQELILLDAELLKIAMREIDGPGPSEASAHAKRLALAAKDGVEVRLWKKLDEVTTYKNWSVLGRLFRRWSRGE